jgi:hypothetical protein
MQTKPKTVNICGITYSVTYVDRPSDVDVQKRYSLLGQTDYWTRTIRIYDDGKLSSAHLWQVLLHEILHAIGYDLHIEMLRDEKNHDQLDLIATALMDTFVRNGWLDLNEPEKMVTRTLPIFPEPVRLTPLSETDLQKLQQLAEDASIRPMKLYPIPKPVEIHSTYLSSTDFDQLRQLVQGQVEDGNLISKASRDRLVRYGFAKRDGGLNFITEIGKAHVRQPLLLTPEMIQQLQQLAQSGITPNENLVHADDAETLADYGLVDQFRNASALTLAGYALLASQWEA